MCSPFENLLLSFYFKDCLDFTHLGCKMNLNIPISPASQKITYLFFWLVSGPFFVPWFCALMFVLSLCTFSSALL